MPEPWKRPPRGRIERLLQVVGWPSAAAALACGGWAVVEIVRTREVDWRSVGWFAAAFGFCGLLDLAAWVLLTRRVTGLWPTRWHRRGWLPRPGCHQHCLQHCACDGCAGDRGQAFARAAVAFGFPEPCRCWRVACRRALEEFEARPVLQGGAL